MAELWHGITRTLTRKVIEDVAKKYFGNEDPMNKVIKVNNQFDAEEILQDTLFAFLEALRDFHGTSSLKTFLFAISTTEWLIRISPKKG